MKLTAAVLLGCLPAALAKSIVVTYPKGTPDSVVEDAKQAIIDGGGHITHTFELLKGFSATDVEEAVISQVSTKTAQYKPSIEDDQVYTIQDSHA